MNCMYVCVYVCMYKVSTFQECYSPKFIVSYGNASKCLVIKFLKMHFSLPSVFKVSHVSDLVHS